MHRLCLSEQSPSSYEQWQCRFFSHFTVALPLNKTQTNKVLNDYFIFFYFQFLKGRKNYFPHLGKKKKSQIGEEDI